MRPQAYRAVCVLALAVIGGGLTLPLASASAPLAPTAGQPRDPRLAAGTGTPRPGPSVTPQSSPGAPATPAGTPTAPPSPTASTTPTMTELRKSHANEVGLVPVIMYHRIVTDKKLPLDRTPKELRSDLIGMAKDHYVPVSAADFVNGRINIPAGTHPVVLTFDDSTPDQLNFDKLTGQPSKNSAIGVLLDVARHHPQFRPVATMYVISSVPFQEGGPGLQANARRALRWLVAHGFDVGNHTVDHKYFNTLNPKQTRAEIAGAQKQLTNLSGTVPVTLAYPGGTEPKPLGIAPKGSAAGASYRFTGAFLAGANPSPSPYLANFPRYEIPRIRGQLTAKDCDNLCLGSWLVKLKKKGGDRYTSDGDPAHIAYPKHSKVRLAKTYRTMARPY